MGGFMMFLACAGSLAGAPGAAPFAVAESGFSKVEEAPGRLRWSSPPGSACMVQLDWWRPLPEDPGKPMVVASERPVKVAGQKTAVLHTSMFDGENRVVDVVMLPGKGFHARFLFTDCGDTEIDGFLAGVK